ncbi:hypothetical protein [Lacticaseibacillus daqingensis]|uniref:hypothetical protein n=1 Tax=Lacticaseibacillus daqingensis TaxID=2486014 RepID=UPI000F7B138A|nr:hypothetical protein [Lacticaseibacillus daqingensis]
MGHRLWVQGTMALLMTVGLLGGCGQSSTPTQAPNDARSISRGLDAVAENDLEKANSYFSNALDENGKSTRAAAYLKQTEGYLKAARDLEKQQFDQAVATVKAALKVKHGARSLHTKLTQLQAKIVTAQKKVAQQSAAESAAAASESSAAATPKLTNVLGVPQAGAMFTQQRIYLAGHWHGSGGDIWVKSDGALLINIKGFDQPMAGALVAADVATLSLDDEPGMGADMDGLVAMDLVIATDDATSTPVGSLYKTALEADQMCLIPNGTSVDIPMARDQFSFERIDDWDGVNFPL